MAKKNSIKIDYNVLIKGGLPAPELMAIDDNTRFEITNIPAEKIEYVKQLFNQK